jgi:hypothetical protein
MSENRFYGRVSSGNSEGVYTQGHWLPGVLVGDSGGDDLDCDFLIRVKAGCGENRGLGT